MYLSIVYVKKRSAEAPTEHCDILFSKLRFHWKSTCLSAKKLFLTILVVHLMEHIGSVSIIVIHIKYLRSSFMQGPWNQIYLLSTTFINAELSNTWSSLTTENIPLILFTWIKQYTFAELDHLSLLRIGYRCKRIQFRLWSTSATRTRLSLKML